METEFRYATINDIDKIIKLCNECFNEDTSVEYATENFLKYKDDENQIYLVGIINDEIIAHAKITIIPTIYEDMNTYAILNHVCVREDYRRHHIGTRLLDKCFEIAKEHKCKNVELWSKNFRIPAHGLYHNYGFEVMDAKFFVKNVE